MLFPLGLPFVDLFKINFIIIFKNEDYVKLRNIYNQEMKLDAKKYCCGFLNESRVTSHDSRLSTLKKSSHILTPKTTKRQDDTEPTYVQ